MISKLKNSLIVKKYYQTDLIKFVKKVKKHTVRIRYLKSKNGQHRKNGNLSKLYITLKKKWYFQKKNNVKIPAKWTYYFTENVDNIYTTVSIKSKISYEEIDWFY